MAKNLIFAISIVMIILLGCAGKSTPVALGPIHINLSTFLEDPHRYAGRQIHIEAYAITIIEGGYVTISDVKNPYSSHKVALSETISQDITDYNLNYFGHLVKGEYYKFPVLVRIDDNGNFRCIADGHAKKIIK